MSLGIFKKKKKKNILNSIDEDCRFKMRSKKESLHKERIQTFLVVRTWILTFSWVIDIKKIRRKRLKTILGLLRGYELNMRQSGIAKWEVS